MKFFKTAAFYLLGIPVLFLLPVASAAAAGPADTVHYDKTTNALTVHVREMPLGELLNRVRAKSGIKFSIQADTNRPVTMDLIEVPLDKAIYSLVQPNSSAMIYSKKEDGTVVLSSVKIFDKGGAPSPPSEPPGRFNGHREPSMDKSGGLNQAARSRDGAGRMLRDLPGNSRRSRSHLDADVILPGPGSPEEGEPGPAPNALE